ncbi:MAG: alpha/beta hydrolase [Phycisphaerales bacterium JB047]
MRSTTPTINTCSASATRRLTLACTSLLLFLTGCTRTLVPTPNLYTTTNNHPYQSTPEPHRSITTDILYVTDRQQTQHTQDSIRFGSKRNYDMTYGIVKVRIGNPSNTWEDLVHDSTHAKRQHNYPVNTVSISKSGTMHDLVANFEPINDHLVTLSPAAQEQKQHEDQAFINLIKDRVAECNRKEVDLYIHGVNNNLPYAAQTLAQIWHFLGRDSVPIVYSWPASVGGLRAYAYSRESSEFTISHLKRVINLIAACEDVERINIIGHSRGCDILLSALRELHIQRVSAESVPPSKIDTVVLAAADIDQGVFRERVFGERVFETPRRIVIYTSPSDAAMGLADWMLDSVGRIGEFVISTMDSTPGIKQRLSAFRSVQIIECRVSAGIASHDYYYTNPAVLSDLILVLKDRLDPGAENGRPLDTTDDGTWRILKSYPQFEGAPPETLSPDDSGPSASLSPASSGSSYRGP